MDVRVAPHGAGQPSLASLPVDAGTIVGLLADRARLAVVAALVLGRTDLAGATGLPARDAGRALARLQAAGLVDDDLRVRDDLIAAAARTPPAAAEDLGYADPAVEQVVNRFVRDGRLVAMPAAGEKRRMVLEHLVQAFEPGRRYAEKEVDAVLRALAEASDHATLRRYLVDHGLLARAGGAYWRSGGWLDVLGDA